MPYEYCSSGTLPMRYVRRYSESLYIWIYACCMYLLPTACQGASQATQGRPRQKTALPAAPWTDSPAAAPARPVPRKSLPRNSGSPVLPGILSADAGGNGPLWRTGPRQHTCLLHAHVCTTEHDACARLQAWPVRAPSCRLDKACCARHLDQANDSSKSAAQPDAQGGRARRRHSLLQAQARSPRPPGQCNGLEQAFPPPMPGL